MDITVNGRRPRGRPKTRWLDRIAEDMRVLKLTGEDAFNRRKWRNHTRDADLSSWEYGWEEEEVFVIVASFVLVKT
ncbi:hypothetical protein ANCDUO_07980 [Ancylostoma duodenale]|uniref:Uncharacterized protein n=1 Tax=Ancylostoma duodenale TaxID=51022 RepID=A0A0C2GX86_9BILA|nr:hypothetical protein ANCDUO_07980 [Ancylostoma duodenale]